MISKPVRLSKRSSYVRFTDEMEDAMSAQRHLDRAAGTHHRDLRDRTRRRSSSGRAATSPRR